MAEIPFVGASQRQKEKVQDLNRQGKVSDADLEAFLARPTALEAATLISIAEPSGKELSERQRMFLEDLGNPSSARYAPEVSAALKESVARGAGRDHFFVNIAFKLLGQQPRHKAARRVSLKEMRDNLVNQLIADMSKPGPEKVNWACKWSFDMPRNPVSGTRYKGRNAMLLLAFMRQHDLADPRFMTARQAQSQGYTVKEGAGALAIEHFRAEYQVKVGDEWTKADPQPKTKAEIEAFLARRDTRKTIRQDSSSFVYHADDIVGLPEFKKDKPVGIGAEQGSVIDFLEENSPCYVAEVYQGEAYYAPARDRIVIPTRDQFSDLDSMARVLLHEQSHATGHPDRLGRKINNRFGSETYAFEELVAELSSMMTANALGLEIKELSRDEVERSPYWTEHVKYVQSWVSALSSEKNPETYILQAGGEAGKASNWLMDNCFEPAIALEQAQAEHEKMSEHSEVARHNRALAEAEEAKRSQSYSLDLPDVGQSVTAYADRVGDNAWDVSFEMAMPSPDPVNDPVVRDLGTLRVEGGDDFDLAERAYELSPVIDEGLIDERLRRLDALQVARAVNSGGDAAATAEQIAASYASAGEVQAEADRIVADAVGFGYVDKAAGRSAARAR